jgi:hypothetical protein
MSEDQPKTIGYLVGGGLRDNLRVRLTLSPQEVQEGAFVILESGGWLFYGLVTDLQLGATDPRFADEQSETRLPHGMARLLHGQTLYTTLEVLPADPNWTALNTRAGRRRSSLACASSLTRCR